jgi:hypothetical protein
MGFFGGKKTPSADVRAMLADAASDLGGSDVAAQALHFFDHREDLEKLENLDGFPHVPLWLDKDYEPDADEAAAEVLFLMLERAHRLRVLDWADSGEQVLAAFDEMFEASGTKHIEPARREQYLALVVGAKRGGGVLGLMEPMRREAEERGLYLHWWYSDGDVHHPLVITPAAYKRWRDEKFGKKFPVLP